jgi:hypothetical protein
MKLGDIAAQYAASQAVERATATGTTPPATATVSPDDTATAVNALARAMASLFVGLSKIKL